MIRSSRTMGGARRTVLSALTLLATLTLALGSCSKRLTTVDPSYTRPEGRFSPDAQLVAWYDSPVEEVRYLDRHQPPIGPVRDPFCPQRILVDDGDSVVSVQHVQLHPPGSVNTMVFD